MSMLQALDPGIVTLHGKTDFWGSWDGDVILPKKPNAMTGFFKKKKKIVQREEKMIHC